VREARAEPQRALRHGGASLQSTARRTLRGAASTSPPFSSAERPDSLPMADPHPIKRHAFSGRARRAIGVAWPAPRRGVGVNMRPR
jgi:hypothetical protein